MGGINSILCRYCSCCSLDDQIMYNSVEVFHTARHKLERRRHMDSSVRFLHQLRCMDGVMDAYMGENNKVFVKLNNLRIVCIKGQNTHSLHKYLREMEKTNPVTNKSSSYFSENGGQSPATVYKKLNSYESDSGTSHCSGNAKDFVDKKNGNLKSDNKGFGFRSWDFFRRKEKQKNEGQERSRLVSSTYDKVKPKPKPQNKIAYTFFDFPPLDIPDKRKGNEKTRQASSRTIFRRARSALDIPRASAGPERLETSRASPGPERLDTSRVSPGPESPKYLSTLDDNVINPETAAYLQTTYWIYNTFNLDFLNLFNEFPHAPQDSASTLTTKQYSTLPVKDHFPPLTSYSDDEEETFEKLNESDVHGDSEASPVADCDVKSVACNKARKVESPIASFDNQAIRKKSSPPQDKMRNGRFIKISRPGHSGAMYLPKAQTLGGIPEDNDVRSSQSSPICLKSDSDHNSSLKVLSWPIIFKGAEVKIEDRGQSRPKPEATKNQIKGLVSPFGTVFPFANTLSALSNQTESDATPWSALHADIDREIQHEVEQFQVPSSFHADRRSSYNERVNKGKESLEISSLNTSTKEEEEGTQSYETSHLDGVTFIVDRKIRPTPPTATEITKQESLDELSMIEKTTSDMKVLHIRNISKSD